MIIGDLISRAASRTALAVEEEVTFWRGCESEETKMDSNSAHDGLNGTEIDVSKV